MTEYECAQQKAGELSDAKLPVRTSPSLIVDYGTRETFTADQAAGIYELAGPLNRLRERASQLQVHRQPSRNENPEL